MVFRRPDESYALIVLNDRPAERTFVVTGLDATVREWTVTSDQAYDVAGDPTAANGPDGITVTLPPLSLVSMVLE